MGNVSTRCAGRNVAPDAHGPCDCSRSCAHVSNTGPCVQCLPPPYPLSLILSPTTISLWFLSLIHTPSLVTSHHLSHLSPPLTPAPTTFPFAPGLGPGPGPSRKEKTPWVALELTSAKDDGAGKQGAPALYMLYVSPRATDDELRGIYGEDGVTVGPDGNKKPVMDSW